MRTFKTDFQDYMISWIMEELKKRENSNIRCKLDEIGHLLISDFDLEHPFKDVRSAWDFCMLYPEGAGLLMGLCADRYTIDNRGRLFELDNSDPWIDPKVNPFFYPKTYAISTYAAAADEMFFKEVKPYFNTEEVTINREFVEKVKHILEISYQEGGKDENKI